MGSLLKELPNPGGVARDDRRQMADDKGHRAQSPSGLTWLWLSKSRRALPTRSFLAKRQAEKEFHRAGIPISFTGERDLPNMSKSTFKFLKCQGKESKAQKADGRGQRAHSSVFNYLQLLPLRC